MNDGEFWPPILFRTAPAAIRDRLIAELEADANATPRTAQVDLMLCALAWIGDATVVQTFARWESAPRSWHKSLYVDCSVYAETAGWALHQGTRQNLFFDPAFAIRPVPKDDTTAVAGLTAFQPEAQSCPWCGSTLVTMISIPPENFHAVTGSTTATAFPILTCPSCTCYAERLFAKVAPDGQVELHPANARPGYLPDRAGDSVSSWSKAGIALTPRRMRIVPDRDLCEHQSQMGGIPAWVQDSMYPKCPDCGETMRFLAQLDSGAFRCEEGVHYAFLCLPCRITATSYQQT